MTIEDFHLHLTSAGWEAVAPEGVTEEDTNGFLDLLLKLQSERTDSDSQKRLLVDVRGLRTVVPGVRRAAYRRAHEMEGWRVAILGASAFHRTFINFLLLATRFRTARYFKDEKAARLWLSGQEDG
jgi:hypothetical protein